MAHTWPKPIKPLHKANRECTTCGLTATAVKYKQTDPGEYHWGVAWRRDGDHGIAEGLRGLPVCTTTTALNFSSYLHYLPGISEDERLALWCEDCGGDDVDPFWTDAEAAEQVTPFCVANLIAICDEHEREHHRTQESPR